MTDTMYAIAANFNWKNYAHSKQNTQMTNMN